ncbi:CRISPR system precrRNA processing endoribonuclease RAMP protein Cas6 [Geoalkalibacter sp.]|uniref:CRISPR system precrRNA processing endoribonuclease RAMP protein Cas6 n=1 Tax=Geoalkalibacter sp. TaxID=3041440 RepID=UPI00272E7581|nr:CRISPR system precrRNA processing endoribonuclease RAMP protein Cas6 [Geoalkalibacter sp.]
MTLAAPRALADVDFVLVDFTLEFQEAFDFDLPRLLRVRRDLRAAGLLTLGDGEAFAALFDPPLSTDPAAVKRFQRPGPSFVIHPDLALCDAYEEGDQMSLSVLFWGRGIQFLGAFAETLRALGGSGLNRGEGRFELTAMAARKPGGDQQWLWKRGRSAGPLVPPILSAAWWLESLPVLGEQACLEFVTPARLLSQGRPLFRPTFASLFPFILRRVTSMIHAHCGLEIIADPRPWQRAAGEVLILGNELHWQDWRTLDGQAGPQELGGLVGRLRVEGESLPCLGWLLHLGSLLQLGKGASFGAGCYRVDA